MKCVLVMLLQALFLTGVGSGLGFALNAVNPKGIEPDRNYFRRIERSAAAPHQQSVTSVVSQQPAVSTADTDTATGSVEVEPVNTAVLVQPPKPLSVKHLEHPYRSISMADIEADLERIASEGDMPVHSIMIVDARADGPFEEGHIPGAYQIDHYRLAQYIDPVIAAYEEAMATFGSVKLIVYCNGGDCEDSIFVCQDLEEAGVVFEQLYLYEGGWVEWSTNNKPIVVGREEVISP